MAKHQVLDYGLILFQVCLGEHALELLVAHLHKLQRLRYRDLGLLLHAIEVLVNRVQKAAEELIRVVLHRSFEHVVDLSESSLQRCRTVDVLLPSILSDLGTIPHRVKESDEHDRDLGVGRAVRVVTVEVITEDHEVEEVPPQFTAVAQALDRTVHVAGVAVVPEADEASFRPFLSLQFQLLRIQLVFDPNRTLILMSRISIPAVHGAIEDLLANAREVLEDANLLAFGMSTSIVVFFVG